MLKKRNEFNWAPTGHVLVSALEAHVFYFVLASAIGKAGCVASC